MNKHYTLAEVISAVSAFWFVSISMIFINKRLLDTSTAGFNVLIFLSWFQCASAVSICIVVNTARAYFAGKPRFAVINLRSMQSVSSLSFVLLIMIVTNNLCLKHVSVAFYYLSRSLSTLFTVIFSYLMLGRVSTFRSMVFCGLIIFGYGVGVFEERSMASLLHPGLLWGVVSSGVAALYCVIMDRTIRVLEENQQDSTNGTDVRWSVTFYTNVNVALLSLPLIFLSGPPSVLYDALAGYTWTSWSMLTFSGIMAICVTFVSSWQVQVTSAVTHNVSGTAKNCMQTLLGCIIYQENRSLLWWICNLIVALGSVGYAWARRLDTLQANNGEQRAKASQPLKEVVVSNLGSTASPQRTF